LHLRSLGAPHFVFNGNRHRRHVRSLHGGSCRLEDLA
jgi:hypothetical protein